MSDIVERLRRHGEYEAAKEIERLRADLEAMKTTLSGMVKLSGHGPSTEQSQRVERILQEEIERLRASNAELLTIIAGLLKKYGGHDNDDVAIAARAAIKKAEGHDTIS